MKVINTEKGSFYLLPSVVTGFRQHFIYQLVVQSPKYSAASSTVLVAGPGLGLPGVRGTSPALGELQAGTSRGQMGPWDGKGWGVEGTSAAQGSMAVTGEARPRGGRQGPACAQPSAARPPVHPSGPGREPRKPPRRLGGCVVSGWRELMPGSLVGCTRGTRRLPCCTEPGGASSEPSRSVPQAFLLSLRPPQWEARLKGLVGSARPYRQIIIPDGVFEKLIMLFLATSAWPNQFRDLGAPSQTSSERVSPLFMLTEVLSGCWFHGKWLFKPFRTLLSRKAGRILVQSSIHRVCAPPCKGWGHPCLFL